MIRPALASVIAGTLCITASPALSLPDLVSNWTAPGWTWPALPRAAPDGAPTNMPLGSGALPGNSWSTYWNATVRNQSGENTGGPFSHFMFLDDYFQASNWSSFLLPNGYAFYMNHPAATPIKGGRHTMLSRADIYNEIFESNESNNDWARQYIWSGLTLSPNAPATRTYDPNVFSTGVGPYWNNEGFEAFAGTHYWNVFAVIPEDASSDFDIHLSTEAPANVPQQGFGFPVASSSHVGWDTDFVILDRNVVPNGTYYAFVQNFNGTANKVVEFDADQGTLFNPGESALFYLDSGEIVEMHEVYLQGGQPTRIQIRRVAGDSDVYVGLFNPAGGFAGSFDAVAWASTIGLGPNNDLFINYTAPVGDYYGIVVAKPEPQSLAKTLHYSVVVSQLPNITRYAPGGWSGGRRSAVDRGLERQLRTALPDAAGKRARYVCQLFEHQPRSGHGTEFLDTPLDRRCCLIRWLFRGHPSPGSLPLLGQQSVHRSRRASSSPVSVGRLRQRDRVRRDRQ